MYLFNKDEILIKYNNVNDIINDFIIVRMEYYEKRKKIQVYEMKELMKLYSNKYRFINELLMDSIDLRKKKSQQIMIYHHLNLEKNQQKQLEKFLL